MSVVCCNNCGTPFCEECEKESFDTCDACGTLVCNGCLMEDGMGMVYCSKECMEEG